MNNKKMSREEFKDYLQYHANLNYRRYIRYFSLEHKSSDDYAYMECFECFWKFLEDAIEKI